MSIHRGAMACLLAAVLMLPAAGAARADTVPHEEFDDAELDLLALKLLLDRSLELATSSILACVEEDTESAESFSLSLTSSLDAPAAVVSDLTDETDSYEYLVTFIPPFEAMALDDGLVVSEFSLLIENITTLRLLADYAVVPPEVYDQAMALLAQTNAYIQEVLLLLDGLEEDALEIAALPELPGQGYLNATPLLEAIQALRDKLLSLDSELDRLAENVLNPIPRLFLMANSEELHLGENLILTGYLFYLGSFIPGLVVTVERNGTVFATADTGESGRFSVTYAIPVDGAELGSWTFVAHTVYDDETYYSQAVFVDVTRIPTVIELDVLPWYELGLPIVLNGSLEDSDGLGLAAQDVSVQVDGTYYPQVTGPEGEFAVALSSTELGFGVHNASASYAGNETHAPSSTALHEFVLWYPALLTLQVSDDEVDLGDTVTLSGVFTNLSLEPIGGARVDISLNGAAYAALTTAANGSFSMVLDTDDIGPGTHVAVAVHDDPASSWSRTVSNEVTFKVNDKEDSGFIPGVITNPDDLFQRIKDVLEDWFLGEHWYIAWAILVALVAMMYLAYKRLKARWERRRAQEEQVRKALQLDPPIFKPRVRPLASLPAGSRKLMKAKLWTMIDTLLGSMSPRDAIVHGYGRFLEFLASDRMTPMDDSLTHREIQTELVFMGYPKETVGSVTGVYEKAMYTGREVTVEDALRFADSLAVLEGYGKVVPE